MLVWAQFQVGWRCKLLIAFSGKPTEKTQTFRRRKCPRGALSTALKHTLEVLGIAPKDGGVLKDIFFLIKGHLQRKKKIPHSYSVINVFIKNAKRRKHLNNLKPHCLFIMHITLCHLQASLVTLFIHMRLFSHTCHLNVYFASKIIL